MSGMDDRCKTRPGLIKAARLHAAEDGLTRVLRLGDAGFEAVLHRFGLPRGTVWLKYNLVRARGFTKKDLRNQAVRVFERHGEIVSERRQNGEPVPDLFACVWDTLAVA